MLLDFENLKKVKNLIKFYFTHFIDFFSRRTVYAILYNKNKKCSLVIIIRNAAQNSLLSLIRVITVATFLNFPTDIASLRYLTN